MTKPSGTFVLVVGPSGAGKDTLIAAAQKRLAGNPDFVFPRRIVTRNAMVELEDHDSINRPTFERMRLNGDYALLWEAHGLGYILPRSIDAQLADGKTVICNVSRRVIDEARAKYPGTRVLLITADPATRAARLAQRGRETEAEIKARLTRQPADIPQGIGVTVIDNSGALEDGVNAFLGVLAGITTLAAR